MISVPITKNTIPHRVEAKYGAGRVMLKPAPLGSGIIAGSSVRVVLELAGVPNVSAKIMSKTNNKITNIKAIFEALQMFKPIRQKREVKKEPMKKEVVDSVKKIVEEKEDDKTKSE